MKSQIYHGGGAMELTIKPIAHIHTDFPEKFGLPRQSMLVPSLRGRIVFESEYRSTDALRGLDGYSHLWLIWGFSDGFASSGSERSFSPTVRPPRLGGNTRVGVFATRSPNRPNPIALSCVKIESIDGCEICVSGIDMADGTPIYDIKPYLPHIDSIPDAKGGFAAEVSGARLNVVFADGIKERIPRDKLDALIGTLSEDPRPSYQHNSERIYGFYFADMEISFKADGDTLTVLRADKR